MKIETLLWVIVFLVYVVSVVIKKTRAASKTSEKRIAKKLPEWINKLNKFISKVQQIAGERGVLEDPKSLQEEIPSERIEPAIKKAPLTKIKPQLMKADVDSLEPADSGKEIPPNDLAYGIQDLRKAVIWSEILAPPLALRDE